MSQVLTNNATKLAQSGEFNLDNPDELLIQELVVKLARTKAGGYSYQPGVLFAKVCKEIKNLANLSQSARLPENVAGKVKEYCEALPGTCHKNLLQSGFVPVRQSAVKSVPDFRNSRMVRQTSETLQKILDFQTQLKDIHMHIVFLTESIHKLDSKQPKDSEELHIIEAKTQKLQERKERLEKLERSIKAEEQYQQEQLKKEQGETTGPR